MTGGLGDTNVLHLPYDEAPTFCWVANGPDEVRRVARTLAREGVDLLKLNISGDGGTSSAGADVTTCSSLPAIRWRTSRFCRTGESCG